MASVVLPTPLRTSGGYGHTSSKDSEGGGHPLSSKIIEEGGPPLAIKKSGGDGHAPSSIKS